MEPGTRQHYPWVPGNNHQKKKVELVTGPLPYDIATAKTLCLPDQNKHTNITNFTLPLCLKIIHLAEKSVKNYDPWFNMLHTGA